MSKSNLKPEIIEEDILKLNSIIDLLEKTDLSNASIKAIEILTKKLEKEVEKKYPNISSKENLDSKK